MSPPSHHHQSHTRARYNHHQKDGIPIGINPSPTMTNGGSTSIRDLIREQSINKLIKMSAQANAHTHGHHHPTTHAVASAVATAGTGGVAAGVNSANEGTASLTMNPSNSVILPKRSVPVPASLVMSMMTNQLAAAASISAAATPTASAGGGNNMTAISAGVAAASIGVMAPGLSSNSIGNSPVIKDNRKILGKTLHAAGVALIVGSGTPTSSGGGSVNGVSMSTNAAGTGLEFPAIPGVASSSNNENHSYSHSQQMLLKGSPSKSNLVMIDGELVSRTSSDQQTSHHLQLPAIPMEVLQNAAMASRNASLSNLVVSGNTTGVMR
jgi:hypothetical protein